jgi:hypothetical protein
MLNLHSAGSTSIFRAYSALLNYVRWIYRYWQNAWPLVSWWLHVLRPAKMNAGRRRPQTINISELAVRQMKHCCQSAAVRYSQSTFLERPSTCSNLAVVSLLYLGYNLCDISFHHAFASWIESWSVSDGNSGRHEEKRNDDFRLIYLIREHDPKSAITICASR